MNTARLMDLEPDDHAARRARPPRAACGLALLAATACAHIQPLSDDPDGDRKRPAFETVQLGIPPQLPPEPTIPPPCTVLKATKTAVNDFLKPEDETPLDTDRIQEALRSCESGKSVKLEADGSRNAFVTGSLSLVSGVTLWIDKDVILFASRNPRDFDASPGTCGTDAFDDSNGCTPVILANQVFSVGVVGEGTIDGRGGEPMIGSSETWWDVAQRAKKRGTKHSNPRLIDTKKTRAFTLYKITLRNSPKFHVAINGDNFVVWGVKVITPWSATNSQGKPLSPTYARNTDGIDPSSGTNGYIVHSYISTGDDCIAIKAGTSGPSANLVIAHNHFGSGHGMSIGTETQSGVKNVHVYDLTIDGTIPIALDGMISRDHSGLRIKSDPSRGGLVENITYSNVCIRDVPNPINITPAYEGLREGELVPDFKNITLHNVTTSLSPGSKVVPKVILTGYDMDRYLEARLSNVAVGGLGKANIKSSFAEIYLGPDPISFPIAGKKVRLTRKVTGKAQPYSCEGKWVKFPGVHGLDGIKVPEKPGEQHQAEGPSD